MPGIENQNNAAFERKETKYHKRIVENCEDGLIPGLFYLDLECGHKTVSRDQVSGYVFCTTCYLNDK